MRTAMKSFDDEPTVCAGKARTNDQLLGKRHIDVEPEARSFEERAIALGFSFTELAFLKRLYPNMDKPALKKDADCEGNKG